MSDGRERDELPLISVVVPCKDRAHYLRETLDSILGQDYPAIECIVGDGGSTDGTVGILRSYGERIRWWSACDGGPFDAINRGWAESRGSILAWLNADDTWEPGAARAAVERFVAEPDIDVVYGDVAGIDAAGRVVWWGPARRWDLRRAVLDCDHIINQPGSFIRRSVVEKAGPLCREWVHDHDLWIRVALTGGRFAAIPRHLANGRIQDANRGMDPAVVIPAKRELIRRTLADPRLPRALARQRRRALSNAEVRGLSYLKPGRPRDWVLGARLLGRAVWIDPKNAPHAVGRLGQLLGTFAARPLREKLRGR